MRVRLRAEVAELIGGDPEGIALTTSTTEGCNTVVAGLRLAARRRRRHDRLGAPRPDRRAEGVGRSSCAWPRSAKAPAAEAIGLIEAQFARDEADRALARAVDDRPGDPGRAAHRSRRPRAGGRRAVGGRDPRRRRRARVPLLHRLGPEVALRAGRDRGAVRAAGALRGTRHDLSVLLLRGPTSPTGARRRTRAGSRRAGRRRARWRGLLESLAFARRPGRSGSHTRARSPSDAAEWWPSTPRSSPSRDRRRSSASSRARRRRTWSRRWPSEAWSCATSRRHGWVRASCGFWTSEGDLDRLVGGGSPRRSA